MSDGRVTVVRDASNTVCVATTTDDKEQAFEALLHAPEEEEMARAQERMEPTPAPAGTYKDRVEEARRRHPDFDKVAFRNVPLYEGVCSIIKEHPNGPDLQYEIATNPRLARELEDLSPELAMAKAGSIADKLASEQGKNRHRQIWY
jgi:hypothetical protein